MERQGEEEEEEEQGASAQVKQLREIRGCRGWMDAELPACMPETKYHCFLFVHVMDVRGWVFCSLEENRIVVNCPSLKNEWSYRSH